MTAEAHPAHWVITEQAEWLRAVGLIHVARFPGIEAAAVLIKTTMARNHDEMLETVGLIKALGAARSGQPLLEATAERDHGPAVIQDVNGLWKIEGADDRGDDDVFLISYGAFRQIVDSMNVLLVERHDRLRY